jgi:hypothetical protein
LILQLFPGQFKDHVDHSFFRLRMLNHLVGIHAGLDKSPWPRVLVYQSWFAYVHSYLSYQAMRETFSVSRLGRVYRAARALCEDDGDTSDETVGACIKSLVPLAIKHGGRRLKTLLHDQDVPTTTDKCSDVDSKADICVAAIYLGRKAHVERLLTGYAQSYSQFGTNDVRSYVFGDAFRAAAFAGDLDMIKFLFSHFAQHEKLDYSFSLLQLHILREASTYGHRAVFDFVFEMKSINLPKERVQRIMDRETGEIEAILSSAMCPYQYERAAAMLGPECKKFDPLHNGCPAAWLARSADYGKIEMVRHFLNTGADPNHPLAHRDVARHSAPRPLLAASRRGFETIVRMLLDAGADPNWYSPERAALAGAVQNGSIAVATLLLDRGADVNVGVPPPIVIAVLKERLDMFRLLRRHGARLDTPETGGQAMEVARLHGLDSMVDMLLSEGVAKEKDVTMTV